ncbi:MAG: FtsX-like permease family protein [Gemmatimonadetes bacterium]|nr:FtsX-like permease family protein [Gemmatimonadota bacterium]
MTLVARTRGDPRALLEPVSALLRQRDPDLSLSAVTTLDEVLATATREQRFTMALMSGFALLALVLAAVGVYGVIAYTVAQRSREIGIRLALGAGPRRVERLLVRQGMAPVLVGLGVGLGVALGVSRFLKSLLYGVGVVDPVTFVVVPVVLAAVAVVAVVVPARRAVSGDPVGVLKGTGADALPRSLYGGATRETRHPQSTSDSPLPATSSRRRHPHDRGVAVAGAVARRGGAGGDALEWAGGARDAGGGAGARRARTLGMRRSEVRMVSQLTPACVAGPTGVRGARGGAPDHDAARLPDARGRGERAAALHGADGGEGRRRGAAGERGAGGARPGARASALRAGYRVRRHDLPGTWTWDQTAAFAEALSTSQAAAAGVVGAEARRVAGE